MTEIGFDPSEMRKGSPLPDSITSFCKPITGLEKATGADFVISGILEPLPDAVRTMPQQLKLRKHTESGILIQRKSGQDLLNSIPKLSLVYDRMREWSNRCWLIYTGTYTLNGTQIVLNGRDTNWSWDSFLNALFAWEMRGGYITPQSLLDDDEFAKILRIMQSRIATEIDGSEIPKVPDLAIVKNDVRFPIRQLLVTLPGVGRELSWEVCQYAGGGWETLTALTGYETLKSPHKPKGLGKKTIENIREFLGIPDDAFALGLYEDDPREES